MIKTAKEIRELLYNITIYTPVVKLEILPDEMWKKYLAKSDVVLSHKKVKTEDNKVQIPVLIISKYKENIISSISNLENCRLIYREIENQRWIITIKNEVIKSNKKNLAICHYNLRSIKTENNEVKPKLTISKKNNVKSNKKNLDTCHYNLRNIKTENNEVKPELTISKKINVKSNKKNLAICHYSLRNIKTENNEAKPELTISKENNVKSNKKNLNAYHYNLRRRQTKNNEAQLQNLIMIKKKLNTCHYNLRNLKTEDNEAEPEWTISKNKNITSNNKRLNENNLDNSSPSIKKIKTEDHKVEISKLVVSNKENKNIASNNKRSNENNLDDSHLSIKKIKTEDNKVEISKLVVSNKEKNIASNKNNLDNNHNQNPPLSSHETNMKFEEISSNNIKERKTEGWKKQILEENIKKSPNKSLINKIKIRDVQTINCNYDLLKKDLLFFVDSNKPVTFQTKINTPLINLHLDTNQRILQHFEYLHTKYFNESVQHTIIIINNIVFINLLTVIHYLSCSNFPLFFETVRIGSEHILRKSVFCIKYVNMLDKILKENCIKVLSLFEDSDYEHGLLLFLLSLFSGLKMLGSKLFEDSNVILQKIQQLPWEYEKKNDFDHNRLITTLKSELFRSYYHKLSNFIGEKSNTDPEFVKFSKLFCMPSVFKNMSYFHSSIDAIMKTAEIREVVKLINDASNSVRSHSREEKVNHVTSNIIQPGSIKTNFNIKIQNKNTISPYNALSRTSGTSDFNIINNDIPNSNFTNKVNKDFLNTNSVNISGKSNNIQFQHPEVFKGSSTFVLSESSYSIKDCKIYNCTINTNNTPDVFLTEAFRTAELNVLELIFPNTNFTYKDGQDETTSTSVSTKHNYIHKKFNFMNRGVTKNT